MSVELRYQKADLEIAAFRDKIAATHEFVNDGAFADVYSLPKNRVVKIGEVNADHYIQYLTHVGIRSANVHFPKIYKVDLYDTDPESPFSRPYYAVEMEELHTLEELTEKLGIRYYEALNFVDNYWRARGLDEGLDSLLPQAIDYVVTDDKYMMEVKDVLNKLYNDGAGADVTRWSNVMYRMREDNTFDAVFTDPVT